jgi:hypothetical protein
MKYENRLRKVPEVALAFWVIMIAATTLGEPANVPKQPSVFNDCCAAAEGCHARVFMDK